jgi:acyl carrier protein
MTPANDTARQHTHASVTAWLIGLLAEILDVSPDRIDPDTPLDLLGVDSATALVICAGVRDELCLPLRPKEVFAHFTADALARHLSAPLPAEAGGR